MQVKCKEPLPKQNMTGCIILWKNRAVGDFSLPPGTLCINRIVVHNLHSSIPNVVHSLYPQHLILDLKLFCDALTGRHLLNQLKKYMRCEIMIL